MTRWLTRGETDDVVWAIIPHATGATAVEISKRSGFALRRVRWSLRRLKRRGRVVRLDVNETAHQWMAVAERDWPENRP